MAETLETAKDERTTEMGRAVLGRGVVIGGVALLAAGVFVASVTISYQMGLETGRSGTTPIIRADDGPVKFRPREPGGMKIPNRNKEIYRRMAKNADKPPPARMLPPPEKPIENLLLAIDPSFAGNGKQAAPVAREDVSKPSAVPAPAGDEGTRESGGVAPAPAPRRKPIRLAAATRGGASSERASGSDNGAQLAAPPPSGGFAAQLAATRSKESAGLAFNKLRKANPVLFKGMRPEIVTRNLGKSRGTWHRLRVGSFASRQAARGFCGKAAARKVACLIVNR